MYWSKLSNQSAHSLGTLRFQWLFTKKWTTRSWIKKKKIKKRKKKKEKKKKEKRKKKKIFDKNNKVYFANDFVVIIIMIKIK